MAEVSTKIGACLYLIGMAVMFFGGAFLVMADPDNPNYTVFVIGIVICLLGALIRGLIDTMIILTIKMWLVMLFMSLIFVVPFWVAAGIAYVFKAQEVVNIILMIALVTWGISMWVGIIYWVVALFKDPKSIYFGGGGNDVVTTRHYDKDRKYTGKSERRK